MPETTITPTAAPAYRTPSPTVSVQQPAGAMHTAVQLTFSLEIASMQLTPTFKMSGLQLKPTSKVVSMRLAPSQDPQPPMNLQGHLRGRENRSLGRHDRQRASLAFGSAKTGRADLRLPLPFPAWNWCPAQAQPRCS
jgi:hypothetical protein